MRPVRYGTRFGCRFGQPHDYASIHETPALKVEVCRICGDRRRWPKGAGGRIASPEYLVAHVRQFAQPNGPTRRVFNKLYRKEKASIHL